MILSLIATLIFFDLILLGFVFFIHFRVNRSDSLALELEEERLNLIELRKHIQEEFDKQLQSMKSISGKIQVTAAEIDQEIKNGADTIAKEADIVVQQLVSQFEEPMAALSAKQSQFDHFGKKIEAERKSLQRLVLRAEGIIKFFDGKMDHHDLIQELEDRKIQEVRALIAQGSKVNQIAVDLGMSEAEVRLISNMNY